MSVHKLSNLGPFGTNCYIVETANNGAVLIDCPYDHAKILTKLDLLGCELKAILLTHGHVDHIDAVWQVAAKKGCPVYIHEDDKDMLKHPNLSLAEYFGYPVKPFTEYTTVRDGDVLTFGDISFTVISTPGHTKGSVCYLMDRIMFTGDTLFRLSVGRTDFPGGDHETLMRSIARLKEIDEFATVHPGHGESTWMFEELKENPFLESLR